MQALETGTQVFSRDQKVGFRVTYWDTVMTVPQRGIEFALFELASNAITLSGAATPAAADTLLDTPSKATAVLGYEASSFKTGVVPNVYQYWGGGAPPGVRTVGRAAMKFSGLVQESGTTTFVLGGSGQVLLFIDGVLKVSGAVTEPKPDLLPLTAATVSKDTLTQTAGYQVHTANLAAGQRFDLYYWQGGATWGGIFCKMIPGAVTFPVSFNTFRRQLRDAEPLSASLISSAPAEAAELAYVEQAVIRDSEGAISTCEITLALAEPGAPEGYRFETVSDETYLVNNATEEQVKANRRVAFEGGYLVSGAEEFYRRFTGHIDRIEAQDDTAILHCRGFDAKLEGPFDENYPDLLSYHANGFIDRRWRGYPVWGIPAMDAWPLEAALAELCYRAGVDGYNLGKSPFEEQPDHGKAMFRSVRTGVLYPSVNPLFWARTWNQTDADGSRLPIYVQRQANYGNVGLQRQDALPPDEVYLYRPEITRRLLDRARELTEAYGYDFRFNVDGQAVIGARNNPTVFTPFVQL